MKQYRFEQYYQDAWDHFETQLTLLEKRGHKRKKSDPVDIQDFPQNYQNICQQLALAEQRGYSVILINQLQQLVQRGHQILYQRRSHFLQNIISFVLRDFPQSVRKDKSLIITAHLIFYLGAIISGILSYYYPDFTTLVISSSDLYDYEEMYSDANKQGVPSMRDADQNWMMFAHYIYNNISIAFRTFASGLVFCIGTLFYLLFNALHFGIIASHLSTNGLAHNFWPFVIGHSAFEVTAILIAAAAGFKIGLAILIPHRKTRMESLRHASKDAIKLIFGVFLFLIIAAFIEAYWSSMDESYGIRYTVGALLWLAVFSYFIFMGREK